jgi:hypothetical protein
MPPAAARVRMAGNRVMKPSGRSPSELQKAARPSLLRAGWYDGEFGEVIERLSQRGNEIFDARVVIHLADGTTLEVRDFLADVGRGGLKFYSASVAAGVGAKYEAKEEIFAADFEGKAVRVKLGIEKRRGFSDRNCIESYAAPAAEIVKLRSVS